MRLHNAADVNRTIVGETAVGQAECLQLLAACDGARYNLEASVMDMRALEREMTERFVVPQPIGELDQGGLLELHPYQFELDERRPAKRLRNGLA